VAMASLVRPPRKYVAILSPTVSIMLNWYDDAHISQRLCSGGDSRVLVARCFTTQKDALCWLTSPAYKEAVATTAALTEELSSATNSPVACIAVATASSRSCFPTSSAGLASLLALVQDPSIGVCITATFATEPIAWEWLENNTGTALLDVVGAPMTSSPVCPVAAGDSAPSVVGPISAPPPGASTSSSARSPQAGPLGLPPPRTMPGLDASAISRVSSCGRRSSQVAALSTPSRAAKRPAVTARPVVSRPTSFVGLFGGARQDLAHHSAALSGSGTDSDTSIRARDKRRKTEAADSIDVDQPFDSSPTSVDGTESLLSPPDMVWEGSSGSTQDRDGKELRALLRSSDVPPARRGAQVRGSTASGSRAAPGRAGTGRLQGQDRSPSELGFIGEMAAAGKWDDVCEQLFARIQSAFISGGPGAGKSTLLQHLHGFLLKRYPLDGEVVVLAPTGTSAKTAGGVTYHSFFGFIRDYEPSGDPAAEAARLLSTGRYSPIKERLKRVRAVLLDEVSLVGANKLDVMHELLCQSRSDSARPCLWYAFGDFYQLGPVKRAAMAFTASCWRLLFGDAYLDLPGAFRQRDPGFIRAVRDARVGKVSSAVQRLIQDCWVEGAEYEATKTKVFHLMPRHKDVAAHNSACLKALTAGGQPRVYLAIDSVDVDPDRDMSLGKPLVERVSKQSRRAALAECVAPVAVQHCLHARVMIISNHKKPLGVCHGSVGFISSYQADGTAVVRLENHVLPPGIARGSYGLLDAGESWAEVACPPLKFFARIYSCPGTLAVRTQVPFVLGWASTIHMAQSLSISRAVLDLADCFEAGMAQTAISRVPTKEGLFIKSFSPSRVYASPLVFKVYREWRRL